MSERGFKGWLLALAIFQCLLLLRQGLMVAQIARDFVSGVPGSAWSTRSGRFRSSTAGCW